MFNQFFIIKQYFYFNRLLSKNLYCILLILPVFLSSCSTEKKHFINLPTKKIISIKKTIPPVKPSIFNTPTSSTTLRNKQIEISYYNFQNKLHHGSVMVPSVIQQKVQQLFSYLRKAKIPMAHLYSLDYYSNNYYESFADNNSFFYTTNQNLYFIFNPVLNPSFIRYNVNSPIWIWPTQGILSLGLRNSGLQKKYLRGVVTQSLVKKFKELGFNRYIGNKNEANFGIFVYPMYKNSNNKAQQHLNQISQKKLIESTSSSKIISSYFNNTFQSRPLTNAIKKTIIKQGLWHVGCPVPLDRLSLVQFSYWNFLNKRQLGHVIVMDIASSHILQMFKQMYRNHFPIQWKSTPGINYLTDHPIKVGGTSSFYCRSIRGSSNFSLHSYGLAIDMSSGINPYIGLYHIQTTLRPSKTTLIPKTTDLSLIVRIPRKKGFTYSIKSLMEQAGFIEWGGTWYTLKDYMHFQTTKFLATLYIKMDVDSARKLYEFSIKEAKPIQKLDDIHAYLLLYKMYPSGFVDSFIKNFPIYKKNLNSKQFLYSIYRDLLTD